MVVIIEALAEVIGPKQC